MPDKKAPEPVVDDTKTADEGNLYDQIKEDLKADLTTEIKDLAVAEVKKELARKATNFAVPKAKEDEGSFGEWLQAVTRKNMSKSPEVRESAYNLLVNKYDYNKKAMEQTSAGNGEELVPVIYSDALFTLEGINPVLFPTGAYVFQMASNIEKYPSWDYSTTPSGGDSAFGAGFSTALTGEGSLPTETQPKTKQVTFTCDKYLSLTDVSTELVENNNVGLQQELQQVIRRDVIAKVDYCAFNGNGSNMNGIIGNAATYNLPRQTVNTVTFQDFSKMFSHVIPSILNDYVWCVHPSVLPSIFQLADQANRIVYWQGLNVVGKPAASIFGIPMMITDNCGVLGTEADVMLIARGVYGIGVNKNLTIDMSKDWRYGYDEITYRCSVRVAGQSKLTSTILTKDATFSLAAFITLKNTTS